MLSVGGKIQRKLNEYGFEITKIYFVSETIRLGWKDSVVYNKNKVLLEHMIGLTIEDEKFIPIKKDSYDKVYFYDDQINNFMSINQLQEYFDFLVRNSDDDCVDFINNRLSKNIELSNNLISNNEENPFKTNILRLNPPIKYPLKVSDNKLTVKFENFKYF